MKTLCALFAPAFVLALFTVLLADDSSQAVHPDKIRDKVRATVGEEFTVEFKRHGDQLHEPSKLKVTAGKNPSVKIALATTSASPFPPPREGATRPYFAVENNFEKTLLFRALVRTKGSKEFVPVSQDVQAVSVGGTFHNCWDFDTTVEEVVFYEFNLSDKPAD